MASDSHVLGYWNLQNFTTSQFYLNYLIFLLLCYFGALFFEEQLGFIKSATGNTFNCHAVSASAYNNPPILSEDNAHGGISLLCKCSINDWVTPLEGIISDRIV